ncbi:hypothetical protein ACWD6N_37320 [Micromonospora sp. NPDC005163]
MAAEPVAVGAGSGAPLLGGAAVVVDAGVFGVTVVGAELPGAGVGLFSEGCGALASG